MATGVKWPTTIHPTLVLLAMPPCADPKELDMIDEISEYERAKEAYEEAKEAYQVALEDLANAHTEAENTRRTMVEAREAFLTVLGNDKLEEES